MPPNCVWAAETMTNPTSLPGKYVTEDALEQHNCDTNGIQGLFLLTQSAVASGGGGGVQGAWQSPLQGSPHLKKFIGIFSMF